MYLRLEIIPSESGVATASLVIWSLANAVHVIRIRIFPMYAFPVARSQWTVGF